MTGRTGRTGRKGSSCPTREVKKSPVRVSCAPILVLPSLPRRHLCVCAPFGRVLSPLTPPRHCLAIEVLLLVPPSPPPPPYHSRQHPLLSLLPSPLIGQVHRSRETRHLVTHRQRCRQRLITPNARLGTGPVPESFTSLDHLNFTELPLLEATTTAACPPLRLSTFPPPSSSTSPSLEHLRFHDP